MSANDRVFLFETFDKLCGRCFPNDSDVTWRKPFNALLTANYFRQNATNYVSGNPVRCHPIVSFLAPAQMLSKSALDP